MDKNTIKSLSKDEKAILREQFAKVWHDDVKMVDFCTGKACGYFESDDGVLVVFDKPSVRKNFWFGEHNYEDRSDEVEAASRSVDFFISRNMAYAFGPDWTSRVTDLRGDLYITYRAYCGQDDDCRLGHVVRAIFESDLRAPENGYRKMTDEECERYADAVENQKALFMKRLRTYLKRYGLTKCSYGTFWADR